MRKNNKNTLSGFSLDSIAQQVQAIIDIREMETGAMRAGPVGGDRPKVRQTALFSAVRGRML